MRAVHVPMGAELMPILKGLETPSNSTGTVVARGAGLRAGAKALESPSDPTVTGAARRVATSGVMGQKSADGIVAKRPP